MSTETQTTDPLQLARQAKEAGIEQLRKKRAENAKRRAERDRQQATEDAEELALEQEFRAAEVAARQQARLAEARERYLSVLGEYSPRDDAAEQLIQRANRMVADATQAVADAIVAERRRAQTGETLTAAHKELTAVDPDAPTLHVKKLRMHHPNVATPGGLAILAAMLSDPRLADDRETALARINSKPVRPDVIVTRK